MANKITPSPLPSCPWCSGGDLGYQQTEVLKVYKDRALSSLVHGANGRVVLG